MTGLEQRDADAAAVSVRPRVTLDQIKTLIASERYFVDDTLTICVLTLTNGYKVTGESAAADPANFNETLGRKIAKEKATAEIWPLAGFLLRDKLHREDRPAVMRCKVRLSGRSQAYAQAPWDNDGKPRGRHTSETYSYPTRNGDKIEGIRHTPDPTDPANIILDGETLSFSAVCPPTCGGDAPENLIFGKMTPNARFEMQVRNDHVLKQLQFDKFYYVDFIPAD